ncbi:MarR family transcriptional regulator [Gordonia sp. LSe1-13]|uniref:MarR family transcriptional regulator n=2 Tax=Gordonia sesuvii TaxID=3116777 RepID=A0ABU7MHM8_9ACTN|nr:MarR family transcriptional regulator [Gordonia sp. LSe1-13]
MPDRRSNIDLVHQIRALSIRVNLLGAEFARQIGMHPTDVRALIALLDAQRHGQVATPGWLGAELHLNSATVTALVDRLEQAGLVARERDPADRRRVVLTVTDKASDLGWQFFGPVIDRTLDVLDSYPQDELDVIRSFIGRMNAAVG